MSDKEIQSEHLSVRVSPSVADSIQRAAQLRGVKIGTIAREVLTHYAQTIKNPIAS